MNFIKIAAGSGALAVILGAFGAHALRDRIAPNLLNAYQTGVLYHLVHSVALLALGLYSRVSGASVGVPGWLFFAGIVLFSGSLYAMALFKAPALGIITPLGGVCFIGAWLAILASVR